ncbi:FAD dependent oxidoreductase [Hyaloraphidium curvatum]|nr:FAD dependent oxidoreductase [Hyaloraphidium curvatum]
MDRIPVTVVGAGVSGLTTALLLQALGLFSVTVVSAASPELPDGDPLYTSPKAGAHWRVSLSDPPEMQKWQGAALRDLLHLASLDSGKRTGIWPMTDVDYWRVRPPADLLPPWFAADVSDYAEVPVSELPPDCEFGIAYVGLTINVHKYLSWLLESFRKLGGSLEHRRVGSLAEAVGDRHLGKDLPIVVNCTGLGSRAFGALADKDTYPTRGQTVVVRAPKAFRTVTKIYDERPGMPYDFGYVIPRDDGTAVLGGTYQARAEDLEPSAETADTILARCLEICPELQGCEVLDHRVGLRPTRIGGIRIDKVVVEEGGRPFAVFSNYGHGGCGYQTSYGCARDVCALVLEHVRAGEVAMDLGALLKDVI